MAAGGAALAMQVGSLAGRGNEAHPLRPRPEHRYHSVLPALIRGFERKIPTHPLTVRC